MARNLWMAMLAGEQAEEQMWRSLIETNEELCEAVKRCYLDEMKPLVSDEELAALRLRYWAPRE